MIVTVLVFLVVAVSRLADTVEEGACETSSRHVRVECRIVSRNSQCYTDILGGKLVNQCGSTTCEVWTGVALEISCSGGDGDSGLVLSRDRDNGTFGPSASVTWNFTASSVVQGNYKCVWSNGSVLNNRTIEVDESVHVIPGYELNYEQACRSDIVPGYNCSVAQAPERWSGGHGNYTVKFNVLGARPISLGMKVLWVDHYPVDLHLTWDPMASNTTTKHVVHLNVKDLFFVGPSRRVDAYLVITASSTLGSATMCVNLQITSATEAGLFVNETLPAEVTVTEGQRAEFNCDALTTNAIPGFLPVQFFTVAVLVTSPPSSDPVQCFNCSFSRAELMKCHHEDQNCSGLQVSNSSIGPPHVLNHRLTAVWSEAELNLTGSEVVCAVAVGGITQWAHTATLTVLPASPLPEGTPKPLRQLVWGGLAGSVAVMVVCGGVCLLSLALWYRRKQQTMPLQLDQCPLAGSSQPSSGASTPTTAPGLAQMVPLIEVSLPQRRMGPGRNRHVLGVEQYRDSMDSGLDVNSTAGDIEAAKVSGSGHLLLALAAAPRHQSLTDLQPRPFAPPRPVEVCVYVSYSDSQANWVRDTLLPLLHSFQPITVTDHEGHMIAGNVISEERLRLLRSADKVIAVVSPDYHCVEWCCYELQHSIQQSPGAEGRLIPILCGGCSELPSTIATLHPISVLDPGWTHKLRVAIHRHHRHSS